jgi:hypothetical protein
LDSFGGIVTFQRVTEKKIKNSSLSSTRVPSCAASKAPATWLFERSRIYPEIDIAQIPNLEKSLLECREISDLHKQIVKVYPEAAFESSARGFVRASNRVSSGSGMGRKPLTRQKLLRRVALLSVHFARNLAYYRAGHGRLTRSSAQFWINVDGNFIDMALIEWCKLLADPKGKHYWANVVNDPSRFEGVMLGRLDMTGADFSAYVRGVRKYRDKFVAHLDDQAVMDIPTLETAYTAAKFYYRHVMQHEAAAEDVFGLPANLANYYDHCFGEARAIFEHY